MYKLRRGVTIFQNHEKPNLHVIRYIVFLFTYILKLYFAPAWSLDVEIRVRIYTRHVRIHI